MVGRLGADLQNTDNLLAPYLLVAMLGQVVTTRLFWGESDLVVNSMVFSCTKPRKNLCFDDKSVMILRIRGKHIV